MKHVVRLFFGALGTLAVAACSLRQPAVVTEDYALPLPVAPAGMTGGKTVSVLPFTASPAASGQMFLYRADDLRYERDFYNRFLAPPAQMLTGSLRQWILQSKAAGVREPGAPLSSDFIVQPGLNELYADYRDTSQPRAVVSMVMVLIRRDPSGNRQVFERTYRQEVPMAEVSPSAAVDGWSRATARIFGKFTADFRRESGAPPPAPKSE